MKFKSAIAYALGSAAAGGAIYYALSRRGRAKPSARGQQPERTLVRVTENGRKYHRDNCQLLHGDTRVITIAEALEHYEPCKACHPPAGVDDYDSTERNAPRGEASAHTPRLEEFADESTRGDGRDAAGRQMNTSTIDVPPDGNAADTSAGEPPARINDGVDAPAPSGIESDPVGESVERGIER